jgi:hypothetical protein
MMRGEEAASRGPDADDDLGGFAEPDELQDAPFAERDYGDEFGT